MRYILELRNPSEECVAILENAFDKSMTLELNAPYALQFSVPADDLKLSNIVLANEVWVREYETQVVVHKFRLQKKYDAHKGTKLSTTIEALGLLAQLNYSTVTDYEADEFSVDWIIDDLLTYQQWTPLIDKGWIDPDISEKLRSLQAPNDKILSVLLKLRDTVGGYIEVDNDRHLNWYQEVGEDKGQQIRYRKNLEGVQREIDYTQLYNRIYAYGAGEGSARIRLSDSLELGDDYIDDADSQARWGGMYIGTFVDQSVTHPETLYAWAQLLLIQYKDPPVSYKVDMVNLAAQDGFEFEALQLGSRVRVIDEDLGIDVTTFVMSIEYPDLDNPHQITVELETQMRDVVDMLAEIYDNQQFENHIATRIGAGQVSVLGAFSVSDWVTGGLTTIKGSVVETGTLVLSWGTPGGARLEGDANGIRLYKNATDKTLELKTSDGSATFEGIITATAIDTDAGMITGTTVINAATIADGAWVTYDYTTISKGKIYSATLAGVHVDTGPYGPFDVEIAMHDSSGNEMARSTVEGSAAGNGIKYASITAFSGRTSGGSAPFIRCIIRNRTGISHVFTGILYLGKCL